MDYSKNVPNKCNHCKYYANKDIWIPLLGGCEILKIAGVRDSKRTW